VRSTGDRSSASSGAGPTKPASARQRVQEISEETKPGPGHVPPRLVTDVERLYVTRQDELIGSLGQTERGPCETVRRPGLFATWRRRRHSETSLTCPSSLARGYDH
jgi:hypothetical protein